MEILELEKHLENRLRNFILGKDNDAKSLTSEIEDFFKKRTQKDIDILNPRNVRLFYAALEILKDFENSEIEKANLDYIYSYEQKPLK